MPNNQDERAIRRTASFFVATSVIFVALVVLQIINLIIPIPDSVQATVICMVAVTLTMAKKTHVRMLRFVRRWLEN